MASHHPSTDKEIALLTTFADQTTLIGRKMTVSGHQFASPPRTHTYAQTCAGGDISAAESYAGIFPNFWLPSGMGVNAPCYRNRHAF
jgi:hypothetical protein